MSKKVFKLFITGFPFGDAKIVEVIEQKCRRDGLDDFYIRYANGGTDTASEKFLFDMPKNLHNHTPKCAVCSDIYSETTNSEKVFKILRGGSVETEIVELVKHTGHHTAVRHENGDISYVSVDWVFDLPENLHNHTPK